MKKTSVSFLAATAALTFAGTASAQICAGFPTMDGQASLAAVVNFPEDLDEFGVEGSYNLAGPLALNAGYLRTDAGDATANSFTGGASFDITSMVGPQPASISLCPVASFTYTNFGDDLSAYTVPVGLGFGTSLPIGATSQLQPYVIPQLVLGRLNLGGESSDWENDFGLRGGANVTFGQFFVGAEVNTLFVDGSDAVFGVKGGIRL